MRTRKILTAAGVALGVLTLGLVAAQSDSQSESTRRGPMVVDKCYVYWKDARVISSKIPGTIDQILVEDGDTVEPDQVLARLDDRAAKIEYEMQKLIGDSELAIKVQAAKLEEYKARQAAAIALYKKGAMSAEDYRLALVNVTVNQSMLNQEGEKQQVEKLKADRAFEILRDHVILSPMRGMIQRRAKREKESLSANEAGAQGLQGLQLFRIVATDKLWVEGQAKQGYLYKIHPGQRVQVQIIADVPEADEIFEGKVVFVDPELSPGARDFLVRAEVENRRDLLKAGLLARMTILPDESAAQDRGSEKR